MSDQFRQAGSTKYWLDALRARLSSDSRSPSAFEDVIHELAQHLESAEVDLCARGLSVQDARTQLLAEFDVEKLRRLIERRATPDAPSVMAVAGGDADVRVEHRGIVGHLAEVLRDLRFGIRALARERMFTAFIVTALALGIGANAAMFGVLDRLLLRGPAHVRDARQVRRVISTTRPADRPAQRTGYLTYAQYKAFRADTQTFAGVAAYNLLTGTMYGVRGNARPVHRGSATANFFGLLGVRPALGRFFTDREDDPDDPQRVVVLGYGFWQSEFGGDTSVIGRTIHLDYAVYTVIGVAPKGFTGVDLARVDAWVPESGVPHSTNWQNIWYWPWLHVIVRVRPDVSIAQVNDALTRLHRNGYQGRSTVDRTAMLSAEPTHYTYAGVEATQTRLSRLLFGISAAVLLIACANVVNLLLARTIRRRRELAVRVALGARRFRIVRLLVFEALLLALAGGVAAVAVAYALGTLVRVTIPDIDWSTAFVDARLLGVTIAAAVLAGALVGVVPALQGSAANPGDALKSGTRDGGGRTSWVRGALMISQAALSAVLLMGAGLFVKSLREALTLDLGIQTERLVTFALDHRVPPSISRDTLALRRELARREAFFPMVAAQLRAWPDIESVALAAEIPFVSTAEYPIRLPGRDSIPALRGGGPFVSAVSHEYFDVVRTPVVHGRPFTASDRAGAEPVAIVNETAARTLWGSERALGQCVFVSESESCATIVGIAADTKRTSLQDEPAIQVYVPREQQAIGDDPRFVVRARGDVARVIAKVRQELLRLDPTILYIYVEQPHNELENQARPWRLGAVIFVLFGVLALIVAAVGLYSVVSYAVAQRTQEIGVRVALGAQPGAITWMALSNAFVLAGTGVIIGLVSTLIAGRYVAPLLFGTSPADPYVMVVVAVVMMLVTLAAAVAPALRARRINPIEALRLDS
jgi:predicted permease